ncbi:MAG TPA: hypothetical protein VKF38_04255 [Anaerolineaceae bacterium]|nr:hypothetical protein [Anaerolineaceae bacterium]
MDETLRPSRLLTGAGRSARAVGAPAPAAGRTPAPAAAEIILSQQLIKLRTEAQEKGFPSCSFKLH